MSLNYSNVNSNSLTLNGLPFTITATYNQGGLNRNLYVVETTLSDYDWRRADLKDYALALLKIWSQDPSNSRKLYYVLHSTVTRWPAGLSSTDQATQKTWPDLTHDASEILGRHVKLNIWCSDDLTTIDNWALPQSDGGLRTRNVILGFNWNLHGLNPAGAIDDYGNAQPMLNNGITSSPPPDRYWQYIWLPNNHVNGDPPSNTETTNHYYLEKIDQMLIDNTITNYVNDSVNNGLTKNTVPTPPPTIVSKTPAPGATNVSVNTPITITFDEELDPATTTGNWTPHPASITYSSKVITVTPSSPLPGTTTINVTAPAGITDTSGNALVLPVSWQFTTEAPAAPPEIVNIHFYYNPGSVYIDKAGNLDDITNTSYQPPLESAAAIFLLEFDKPLDDSAITSAPTKPIGIIDLTELASTGNLPYFNLVTAAGYGFEWWKYYDDVHNLTSVNVGGFTNSTPLKDGPLPNSITSSSPMNHCLYVSLPGGVLKAGHEYGIWHIPEYIKGTDNTPMNRYNTGTAHSATWQAGPSLTDVRLKLYSDIIAPTVVSKTPANGATGVHVNSSITVTFSEEVILPVGQNVTYSSVNQAGNWISQPAHVVYSSKTVTITPINPLPGTSIINVAVPTGVTDLVGNALPLQNWSFMTAAPPDTRVPIEAYAIGFTKDPDNFKSIPLTKSGTITQDFKIPVDDIDGSKIMYLRLRDEDGLISPNYRIALRVLDFELETFEVDTHGYCGGTTNQIDVLFDTDTDPTTMEYGFLVDDSGEPTIWNPVTPLSYDSVGKYKLNFNLDVSTISSGQHELYVWLKTLEGEKEFCKTDFVSEPISADPYGMLTIKKSMIDGGKKKIWVEANVFDAGVGVSAISFVESTNPASFESINIIQNKRITKLFEYDASANTTNTFNLIIEDAVGRTSALITTSIDLSGVY